MWQYSFSLSKNTLNPNMKQQNIYIYIYNIYLFMSNEKLAVTCKIYKFNVHSLFVTKQFSHIIPSY